MIRTIPKNITSFTSVGGRTFECLMAGSCILLSSCIALFTIDSPFVLTCSIAVCLVFAFVTLVNIWNGLYVFLFFIPVHLLGIAPLNSVLSEFDFALFSALKDIFLYILAYCFLLAVLMRRISLPKNKMTGLVVLFLFVNAVLILLSPGRIALWGFRQQSEFTVFYFLIIGLITTTRDIRNAILAFTGSAIFVLAYALYVLADSTIAYGYELGYLPEHIVGRLTVFGGPETSGFFSTYVSTVALVMFGFLFFYRRDMSTKHYVITTILTLLCTVEVIFSFSRRAWVAIPLAIVFISLLARKIRFVTSLMIILVAIFCVSYLFSPKAAGILHDRLLSISDSGSFYNVPRLQEWRHLLVRSKYSLLIGEGFGAVGSVSNKFDTANAANTHNFYLSRLVQTGIVGLLSFMLVSFGALALMIKTFLQSRTSFLRAVSAGVIMAFVSLLIQSFFSLGIEIYPFNLYYWFFVGLIVAISGIIKKEKGA